MLTRERYAYTSIILSYILIAFKFYVKIEGYDTGLERLFSYAMIISIITLTIIEVGFMMTHIHRFNHSPFELFHRPRWRRFGRFG